LFSGRIGLRLRLLISQGKDERDNSNGRRFRFVVVDLDRGEDYPANFVCMLPMRVRPDRKEDSVFVGVFGDESVEMAKKLLVDALRREYDSAVKGEIERRLKLFEVKPVSEGVCVSCGRRFQRKPGTRFKQRFCEECVKKKFAGRE
jgi:hypothetical protein